MCDAIAINIGDENVCLTEDQRVRARHDHKQASKSILLWKAHLLRTVTQEKANLDKGSTLMILDWAIKFQPMKFREWMDDFFGMRGRSCYVNCAITRDDNRLEEDTFLTPVS